MSATAALPEKCAAFLAAVDARPAGDGKWSARCPAHDDRSPSLSIGMDDKGLWAKCHAGCEFRHVLRAAGFGPADLFFDAPRGPAGKWDPPPTRKFVCAYDYRDEAGILLYQKIRYEPKSFGCRRPCPGEGCTHPGCTRPKDGWHWQMSDVRRVVYRLPEIVAAPGRAVLVVGGEKDADSVAALGLLATCNPEGEEKGLGGAHRWRDEYSVSLLGRPVVVLPDLDPQGLRHADGVIGSLVRHGAASVRAVLLPGGGKDVSDWLAAQRCGPAEARARLETLIRQTPGR